MLSLSFYKPASSNEYKTRFLIKVKTMTAISIVAMDEEQIMYHRSESTNERFCTRVAEFVIIWGMPNMLSSIDHSILR